MLKHFTENTYHRDGAVVDRFCFVPLPENCGDFSFLSEGMKLACIKGFLIDQLQDGS